MKSADEIATEIENAFEPEKGCVLNVLAGLSAATAYFINETYAGRPKEQELARAYFEKCFAYDIEVAQTVEPPKPPVIVAPAPKAASSK